MDSIGPVSLLIIVANIFITYKGLSNYLFFNKNSFIVGEILIHKKYRRLVSSGFLHVNWWHFLFNMLSLYCFSGSLENYIGTLNFLIVYFSSIVGGNLLALYINRNNSDYSSVGASGAVSGIIFSAIVLNPEIRVGLFLIPFSIPGWAFAFLFILISIYGIRSKSSNIGHESHLGGALIGLAATMAIEPSVIFAHYFVIALMVIPAVFFIFKIITKPHSLLVDNYYFNKHNYFDIDEKYSLKKMVKEKEIDRILDKIYSSGIESLSKKEKEMLDRHAEQSR